VLLHLLLSDQCPRERHILGLDLGAGVVAYAIIVIKTSGMTDACQPLFDPPGRKTVWLVFGADGKRFELRTAARQSLTT
jgi:hypothetical protein